MDTNSNQTPEEKPGEVNAVKSMIRAMTGLGLFAILTAGLIALTQTQTADRINEQIKAARSKALFQVVPQEDHDNQLLDDAFWLQADALGLNSPEQAFIAQKNGETSAIILPAITEEGYTGPISLIIGLDINGTIKGVRVISHKETPGLGDKIDIKKSDWIRDFEGHSLSNTAPENWAVKKDGGEFDQLTGATITPRAIVSIVHKTLQYYREHRDELLAQAPGAYYPPSQAETGQ